MLTSLFSVAVVGPLPRQQRILASKLGCSFAARLRFLDHQSGSITVPASCHYAVAWVDFLSHRHLRQVIAQMGRTRTIPYSGGMNGLANELLSLMMAA